RWLLNWLATGTCWLAMLSRSVWMVAWLMVSLKTQTLGPKEVAFSPGHKEDGACAGRAPVAALAAAAAGTAARPAPAASPAPAIRAPATYMAGPGRPRAAKVLIIMPPRRAASCGSLIALPWSLQL